MVLSRSLQSALICISFWSTTLGPDHGLSHYIFGNLKMPCSDKMWESKSKEGWKYVFASPRDTNSWQQQLEFLPYESPNAETTFGALSTLSGVVLYADDLRESSNEGFEYLRDQVKEVFGGWVGWYLKQQPDPLHLRQFITPLALYLQILLEIDIRPALKLFRLNDFLAMRGLLRQGDLAKAYRLSLTCLAELAFTYCDMALILETPSGKILSQPSICAV